MREDGENDMAREPERERWDKMESESKRERETENWISGESNARSRLYKMV